MRLPSTALAMLTVALASSAAGQAPHRESPPDRFFSADSVADAFEHFLQFRSNSGLSAPIVHLCDTVVTDETVRALRGRLDRLKWPDVRRVDDCGRPGRIDEEGVGEVLVVGPIEFTPSGAIIYASRWRQSIQIPESAKVSRQFWRTFQLTIHTPVHSDRIPRRPRPGS